MEGSASMENSYSNILSPIRINGVRFKNRIFSAPIQIRQKDYHGNPNDYGIAFFEARARGGAAVVCIGDTPVEPLYGASQYNSFYLSDPGSLTALSEIAAAIKQYGALASLELSHGGMMADPAFNEGREPIGPTDMTRPDNVHVHGMDQEMIDYIVSSFAKGAGILKRCGFDMCTIHAGHSTLIEQFLSPRTNRRTDEYGGSLENRMRFALAVVDAVRQAVGKAMLIEVRISGDEFAEGGFTQEEMIEFSKQLKGRADIIHVSAGVQNAPSGLVRLFPSNMVPNGCNVYLADAIRKATGMPVVAVGGITTPALAEEIVATEKADFVALGRAMIADPEFVNKIRRGEEPTPCMRCLNCLAGLNKNRHLTCTVNPTVGSEHRIHAEPVPAVSKRVLVIGGGAGGMTAAITAASRGHKVLLCEAGEKLGGHMLHADYDERKHDLRAVKENMIHRLMASNAEVRLGTHVDGTFIQEYAPDAVICAVGSHAVAPPIEGIDSPNVRSALDIYDAAGVSGDNVVIIGGGFVGCETALYLADQGKKVTILEMLPELDIEDAPLRRMALLMELRKSGVQTITGQACSRITAEGVWAKDKEGVETLLPADTVLTATGMRGDAAAVDELQKYCREFYPVGDCQRARKVTDAVREGYFAALYL